MLDYIKKVDELLAQGGDSEKGLEKNHDSAIGSPDDSKIDYNRIMENHLRQIAFFQHERLIHLMVTLAFAVLLFMTFALLLMGCTPVLCLLFVLFLALLIPYIFHYYWLENGVQRMVRQYDALSELIIEGENASGND